MYFSTASQHEGGNSTNCGLTFKEGDTVKMQVDTGKMCIAFAVNNNDFREVSEIAVSQTPYYMALYIFAPTDAITLCEYSFSGAQNEELKEQEDQVLSLSFAHFLWYTVVLIVRCSFVM